VANGALASLALACFAEEVLFRGVFLREIAVRLGFWRGNLLTAALFVAIHWPGWYAHRGIGAHLALDSVGVFCVGLVAGFLWRMTHSLWPAVAFHLAHNVLVTLLK
jgi:membrane protease YdiL (CAAX protease family)